MLAPGAKDMKASVAKKSDGRFLRKRYRWFAIAGGVLLTVTLTVRDSLHEQLHDLNERIEAVIRFNSLASIDTSTYTAVLNLSDEIHTARDLASRTKAPSADEQFVLTYNLANRRLDRELHGVVGAFDEIQDLAGLLPDYKGNRIEKMCKMTNRHIKDFASRLGRRQSYQPVNGVITGVDAEKNMDGGLQALHVELGGIGQLIVADAGTTRTRAQRRYLVVSAMSFGPIALALVLSIVGKAFDEHGDSEIETAE